MDTDTPNITQDTTSPLNMYQTNNFKEFNIIGKKESEDCATINSEDPFKNSNVIMLGSIVPKETENKCSRNTSRGRPRPKEFEALGVSKEDDKDLNVFTYGNDTAYEKCRLKTVEDKPEIQFTNDNPLLLSTKKIKIEAESYPCPDAQCSEAFYQHNIKYTCTMCSQTFETNTELVTHKSVHDSENRSYLCHGCKLAFSNHCDFLIHELTHCKNNRFICPECGLTSHSKFKMKLHIYTHFKMTVTCPSCDVEVPTRMLLEHMSGHNRIVCVECGILLHNKTHYEEHMAVHTGVKAHQCLYCGKGFTRLEDKLVHTRLHGNDKPFSCNVCGRKFVHCIRLERHVQICKALKKEGKK